MGRVFNKSRSSSIIYLSIFISSIFISNVNGGLLDMFYSVQSKLKNGPKFEIGLEYPPTGKQPLVKEIGFKPKPYQPQGLLRQHSFPQPQFKQPYFKTSAYVTSPFTSTSSFKPSVSYFGQPQFKQPPRPIVKEVTFMAPVTAAETNGENFPYSRNTVINFYFQQNLAGKPKQVFLRKEKCMNVPSSYSFDKPQSVWASDCVMVYQKDFCNGPGVRVAGSVFELQSSGLYEGISSVKPCEGNIQIHFNEG